MGNLKVREGEEDPIANIKEMCTLKYRTSLLAWGGIFFKLCMATSNAFCNDGSPLEVPANWLLAASTMVFKCSACFLGFPASSDISSARLFCVVISPTWLIGFTWKNSSRNSSNILAAHMSRVGFKSWNYLVMLKSWFPWQLKIVLTITSLLPIFVTITCIFMASDWSKIMKTCLIIPSLIFAPLFSSKRFLLALSSISWTENSIKPSASSWIASHVFVYKCILSFSYKT